jgi:8-oxo-dGTP pyrophosphatase MutT (NUDIX family)
MSVSIDVIRERLGSHSPRLSEVPFEQIDVRASVALVLREASATEGPDSEILLIRRADKVGDVWSGDIAFPGGRVDSVREPVRAAAERETREEVGLDLSSSEYLGRLDDLSGRTHSVVVSAFVYRLTTTQPIVLNHEVQEVRWMPFGEVCDSSRQVRRLFDYRDSKIELPGLRVFDDDRSPVLWGLTYRFLELFMRIVERPIPDMPWRSDL